MVGYFLLGEVAKILGCRPNQITYLITSGQAPEPEQRIANKRLFSDRDIVRLARRLKAEPNWSAVGRDVVVSESDTTHSLTLRPPFEVFRVGENCHEIRDGDGVVSCWASDRASALIVAGLLESAVRG